MKKIITLITIFISTLAMADSFEVGKWKFYDGSSIKSIHDTKAQCVDKLQSQQALATLHTYTCIQRIKRVVDAVIIPDPTPTPDPTPSPDPTPPPTGASRCVANANSGDYLSKLSQDMCLSDGLYTRGLNVPSGMSVVSEHIGGAVFTGGDSPWTSILTMSGDGSTVDGIKVHHPDNSTSDACAISGTNNTMINTSCSHGGAHKHKIPLKLVGSGHLIQDSWFYGEGRYVLQCFGGSNMIIKGNVARWDSTTPNETGEPNATFSIYACSDMLIENNVSVDYGVPQTRMRFGGDFYMPAHRNVGNVPNNNHFVGNVAYNHAVDTDNRRGIRLDPDMTVTGTVIDNFTVDGSDRGFMVSGTAQSTQIGSCKLTNVTTPGANCTSSSTTLPTIINQALIKTDMCASGERQSDWCLTNLTLSEYVN